MYINNKNGDNESNISTMKARQHLAKSRESLYSTMLREPIKESKEESEDCSACGQCDSCCDNCCCSFWSWVLIILFLMGGFSGGVLAGAIWQQNGFLREIGQKFPALNRITDYYSNNFYRDNYYNNKNNYNNYNGYNNYNNFYGGGQMQHGGQYNDHNQDQNVHRTRVILPGEEGGQSRVLGPGDGYQGDPKMGHGQYDGNRYGPESGGQGFRFDPRLMPGYDPRCVYNWSNYTNQYVQGSCALCAAAKVINVTGAGYADCSGLYAISNMTSIWDSKRIVFERIAGGWRPMDKRYIYWNAHFFGESFYGWSIGDRQSLVESGPFHSQGRAGASTHPWQGVWKGNVTVQLVSCNIPSRTIRWNSQTMDELQRMREREREMNLLKNMQMNQPMDGGVYINP